MAKNEPKVKPKVKNRRKGLNTTMCTLYYMIIKDAMVIIHLAKMSILDASCDYFKKVVIPEKVYDEVMKGKEKGYLEIIIVEKMLKEGRLRVEKIKNISLLKKANEYNIQGGEAEAIALYWQEKAEYLATDDDNVRKKSEMLNVHIIGTPVILNKLYREKRINKDKFLGAVRKLQKIGWFSSTIIDKMLMEAQ